MRQSPGFFTLSGYTTKPNKIGPLHPQRFIICPQEFCLLEKQIKINFSSSFEYAIKQYILLSSTCNDCAGKEKKHYIRDQVK
jgi:hypothetical protein